MMMMVGHVRCMHDDACSAHDDDGDGSCAVHA
jgi:hypothetical protein